MHVFTLVITPGSRTTAYARAGRLLTRTAAQGIDYWTPGGRFRGRLQELGLVPEGDPWPEAIPISRIPRPVPERLLPIILVTPRGAWLWEPVGDDQATKAKWAARVNRLINQYSGGHTAVLMDTHF